MSGISQEYIFRVFMAYLSAGLGCGVDYAAALLYAKMIYGHPKLWEETMDFEGVMQQALKEARQSLREGNNGFGAVIVKDGRPVATAHDRENTDNDPTSHAEINAIKKACKMLGKNLSGCVLVSTHEPCPMCAGAIVWSGIGTVAYGYSIRQAVLQNRARIDLPCEEVFGRAGVNIVVHAGILEEACSVLYRQDVRREIKSLRNADDAALDALCKDSVERRRRWFYENNGALNYNGDNLLDAGYNLLLKRLNITPAEAPVASKTDTEIVFHSQNFCPTLEACKILGLDTRRVCKKLNEASMDMLMKQIDGRLTFSRNYDRLRPCAPYCEEKITLSPLNE